MASKKRKNEGEPDDEEPDPTSDEEREARQQLAESKEEREQSILNNLQLISEYPLSPASYFTQRQSEISTVNKGVLEIRSLFSHPTSQAYFPKELIDLCAKYYVETEEVIIKRTIKLFQGFSYYKYIAREIRKRSSPVEKQKINDVIAAGKVRGRSYLWWFQMRELLPSFIPLGDINIRRRKEGAGGCSLRDENDKKIAGIFYRFGRCGFGLNNYETAGNPLRHCWQVADAIPYLKVIGPYLNTSTVTLERLEECAVKLETHTGESRYHWVPILFELFKGLVAIHLWSSDEGTFEYTQFQEDAVCAQFVAANEWNSLYEEYKFVDGVGSYR